jgi:pyruvate kinase
MMAETCLLAEAAICYPPLYDELRNITARPTETVETVAFAAVAAASEQGASAILVLSTSGNTARLLSKYRPSVPIIAGRLIPPCDRPHTYLFSSDTKRANFSSDTPS